MSNLTLGSLFDGSGGFPLGGLISGITPLWASEIEPFPIRVTSKRMPQVKHLGDISTINGADIEPVDIITFGSPCTDMSVAGKRAGLEGEQSVLFYEAIRIIKEMRCATNGSYPRFIVGRDYSVAWRTLDAQYFGVPQLRKRIHLVADFTGRCAGKILFESEGLSGDFKKSICSWQGTAGSTEVCFGETSTIVLNDQGGQRMDVLDNMTSTLRAKANHPPCVMFENHSQDTRYNGPLDIAPTVSATYGTGGNNQPFVTTAIEVHTPKTLKIRSGCEGGGKGALIQDNKSATLSCINDQSVFVPTAYGICSDGSNSMKSNNPHSGIYKAETSRTIDGNGGNPSCNQGGIAVVESYSLQGSMIGRKDENGPNGDGINEEVSFTLNTTDRHAVFSMTTGEFMQVNEETAPTLCSRDYKDPSIVTQPCYSIDRETFNSGKNFERNPGIKEDGVAATLNAQGPSAVAWNGENVSPTLTANNAGGNQRMPDKGNFTSVVEPNYTVRRLTPKECGRLQGFPDFWCKNLGTENPTKEDIAFWTGVFETHRKIIGKSAKPKTEKQIIKWIQNPNSDSAEYKMWGNGVALPCVCLVLSGIAYYAQNNDD